MGWVLQLVETGLDNRAQRIDVMEISRPNELCDIGSLGLTLPEAKQLPPQAVQCGRRPAWSRACAATRTSHIASVLIPPISGRSRRQPLRRLLCVLEPHGDVKPVKGRQ